MHKLKPFQLPVPHVRGNLFPDYTFCIRLMRPEHEAPFRCPIGLRLGQNQPGEIAISVAAELIQVRDSLASSAVSRQN
jgi:xanthine/CO dehydrogenase XdhC/CoxF family maturation factor